MNILNKLTIVLPTYNRKEYALRAMRYWSGRGPTVLVADGSEHPIDEKCLRKLTKNIIYMHFKSLGYSERIKSILHLINTDYVMLHADDEFFLPCGLINCIKEIEREDLICCLGRCLQINYIDNKIIAVPWTPLHASFENYLLMDEHPEQRVIKHMAPYLCSTIFGVTKTQIWKNNWMFTENQLCRGVREIIFEIISAFQGKSKVINYISWIRSDENEPIHRQLDNQGKTPPRAHEIWLDCNKREKDDLLNQTALRLQQIDPKRSINELKILIENAMYVFSKSADLSFMIRDMTNVLVGSNNSKLVEEALKAQYKIGIFNEQSLTGETPTLIEMADKWRKLGILSNPIEIKELEDSIIKFHNN